MSHFFSKFILVVLIALGSLPLVVADMAEVAPLPAHPEARLKLPPGFRAQIFARLNVAGSEYARGPRMMAFSPEGDLYLSLGMDNKVVMLPDRNGDGVADKVVTVAENLNAPNGLAFVDGNLLVANQDGIVRLEQKNGQWPASEAIPVISGLPAGGHMMKTLRQGPDGYLYLNVGSSCNVCVENDPMRATILRFTVDGKPAGALTTFGRHAQSPVWAWGLRNAQGMAWNPETGAMYATNNGADMRAGSKGGPVDDELPPEHLNRIEAGKHYGWPHCWGSQVTDPNFPGTANFCATMQSPEITFRAHSTPIGIAFLKQSHFPAEYRSDAIVALHGSWNRVQPYGYKLVRVKFEKGRATSVTDFATGWLEGNAAWGRPVDVVVGPDGALYMSDDRAGMIVRISYKMTQ